MALTKARLLKHDFPVHGDFLFPLQPPPPYPDKPLPSQPRELDFGPISGPFQVQSWGVGSGLGSLRRGFWKGKRISLPKIPSRTKNIGEKLQGQDFHFGDRDRGSQISEN